MEERQQNSGGGLWINPSRLIGLLMETGIKRVTVTSPTFTTLSAGSASTTPQVAKIGTITLTSGGMRMSSYGLTAENFIQALPDVLQQDKRMAALASAVADALVLGSRMANGYVDGDDCELDAYNLW